MVGGLKRVDHVVKIGFLNHDVSYYTLKKNHHHMEILIYNVHLQVDKLLSTYLELYDIVLTGDASMDVVNAVLRAILT